MKNNKNSTKKRKISISAERWSEKLWADLISNIYRAGSEKEIKRLLEKLFSEDEKIMILKRLSVIALIRSGKSYQEISDILWLSPNTISTIKKNLFNNHKNYKSYLAFYGEPRKYSSEKIKIKQSLLEKQFSDIDLWELLKNPPRPPGTGLKER